MGSALADRVAPDALARASDDVVAADVRERSSASRGSSNAGAPSELRKHSQARRQSKVLASRW
jgi:hypothetical protein